MDYSGLKNDGSEQVNGSHHLSSDKISEPIAPHLSAPVAPFAGKSKKKIAATAAKYYGECSLHGINPREADNAAIESQSHFQNWWLQARFKINQEYAGVTSGSEDEGGPLAASQAERKRALEEASSRKRRRSIGVVEEEVHRSGKRTPSSSNEPHSLSSQQESSASECEGFGSHLKDDAMPNQIFSFTKKRLKRCKAKLLKALAAADGETTCPKVKAAVEELREVYKITGVDVREDPKKIEHCLDGVWLTMSKPNYPECLGKSDSGEYMYSLGRMSFDMFRPTGLVCSIQGVFNPVFVTDAVPDAVPRSLRKEVAEQSSTLRTYNIVTAFTVNSNTASVKPIRGVMTTYSYMLPDPSTPNRLTVFFTGGLLEPNDETDATSWKQVFGSGVPKRFLTERARVLAAKVLLGASVPDKMEEDGSMSYYLKRPIGGHGTTFVDVIYLDETLRVMQGQTGSLYVLSRVPSQR